MILSQQLLMNIQIHHTGKTKLLKSKQVTSHHWNASTIVLTIYFFSENNTDS